MQQGQWIEQVLVKWMELDDSEATWENQAEFRARYPTFHLEDEDVSMGVGVDTIGAQGNGMEVQGKRGRPARQRSAPKKFEIEGYMMTGAKKECVTQAREECVTQSGMISTLKFPNFLWRVASTGALVAIHMPDTRASTAVASSMEQSINNLTDAVMQLVQQFNEERAKKDLLTTALENINGSICEMKSSLRDMRLSEARAGKSQVNIGTVRVPLPAVRSNPNRGDPSDLPVADLFNHEIGGSEDVEATPKGGRTRIDAPFFNGDDVDSWLF